MHDILCQCVTLFSALLLRKSNIIGRKSLFYILLSSDDVVTVQQQTLKYKEHKNSYLWIRFGSVELKPPTQVAPGWTVVIVYQRSLQIKVWANWQICKSTRWMKTKAILDNYIFCFSRVIAASRNDKRQINLWHKNCKVK